MIYCRGGGRLILASTGPMPARHSMLAGYHGYIPSCILYIHNCLPSLVNSDNLSHRSRYLASWDNQPLSSDLAISPDIRNYFLCRRYNVLPMYQLQECMQEYSYMHEYRCNHLLTIVELGDDICSVNHINKDTETYSYSPCIAITISKIKA